MSFEAEHAVVDLVHNYVHLVLTSQGIELNIASPGTIFRHLFKIIIEVFIYENSIFIWVTFEVLDGRFSILLIFSWCSAKLVGNRPEKAVAVASHLVDSETYGSELSFKLFQIFLFLNYVEYRLLLRFVFSCVFATS